MPPILTTGPDPDTRTPKFKCPPGTVDTHIHLFGPEAQYSWDPNTFYTARDATPEDEPPADSYRAAAAQRRQAPVAGDKRGLEAMEPEQGGADGRLEVEERGLPHFFTLLLAVLCAVLFWVTFAMQGSSALRAAG